MAEWLKVLAWKASVGLNLPRVRISLSPPNFKTGFWLFKAKVVKPRAKDSKGLSRSRPSKHHWNSLRNTGLVLVKSYWCLCQGRRNVSGKMSASLRYVWLNTLEWIYFQGIQYDEGLGLPAADIFGPTLGGLCLGLEVNEISFFEDRPVFTGVPALWSDVGDLGVKVLEVVPANKSLHPYLGLD